MSSSLGGVSRRSGLAACACRKESRASSGPPAMGGRGCPEALPLWTLCSYLGARGFDPQATAALSLSGRVGGKEGLRCSARAEARPAELRGMGTTPRSARALRVQPADRSTFTPAAQTARASCRGENAGRPVSQSARSRDDPRPIPLQLGLAMARQ